MEWEKKKQASNNDNDNNGGNSNNNNNTNMEGSFKRLFKEKHTSQGTYYVYIYLYFCL